MIKVFEGGTCNNSTWRDFLELSLKEYTDNKCIELFNPVVDDWNEEAQKKEYEYKNSCDVQLFVITPKMTGVFSIAEAVDCSNKYPEKCVFCVLEKDGSTKKFTEGQMKSLIETSKMIITNGGHSFLSLDAVKDHLINMYKEN